MMEKQKIRLDLILSKNKEKDDSKLTLVHNVKKKIYIN